MATYTITFTADDVSEIVLRELVNFAPTFVKRRQFIHDNRKEIIAERLEITPDMLDVINIKLDENDF